MLDVLQKITVRNYFYRYSQRKMLCVCIISMISNILFLFFLIYMIVYPPAPKYFSVGINGHIAPIIPLEQPNQSDDVVLDWASKAALAAFSYSYVNYRGELEASSGFFTAEGWLQFLKALEASNNLEAVKTKELVVSSELISTNLPHILNKGLLKTKHYFWHIEVPILVTYQNNTAYTQQYNIVNIWVERVPMFNAPRGVGISQLVVVPVVNKLEAS